MAETGPRRLQVLLDVDVVLDVLTRREPFFRDSATLLAACETGRCQGYVAAHTLTTLWYLLAKYHDAVRARARVSDLLRVVEVAPIDRDAIEHALTSGLADFEDAVQAAAAVGVAADYVATRNLTDFSGGPIPALIPGELIALIDAPPL